MTALTIGLVTRHFQARAGGWDPAMLDIAQDHALCHLSEQGLFNQGLVFKGGTALRKCRAGAAGRFSTDLDFAADSDDVVADVLLHLDGLRCHGFTFTFVEVDEQAGRAALAVAAPLTRRPPHAPGAVGISSKVELSPRRPWLVPDRLAVLRSGVHLALDHELPVLPVMTVTESVAEKLARYARVALARDLYDLWWYGRNVALEEAQIRSMWVRKVYGDVVIDGRWRRRFDPAEILVPRQARDIDEKSIGFLTHPADVAAWEREFRARYAFLSQLEPRTSCGRRATRASATNTSSRSPDGPRPLLVPPLLFVVFIVSTRAWGSPPIERIFQVTPGRSCHEAEQLLRRAVGGSRLRGRGRCPACAHRCD